MSPNSSSVKAQLYSTTLDQARRQGLFSEAYPATTKGSLNHVVPVNGANHGNGVGVGTASSSSSSTAGMDWKELLRKFTKHNPTREVVAAAAHAEQVTYSLFAKAAPQLSASPNGAAADSSLPPLPPPLPSSSHGPAHTALDALDRVISHGGSPLDLASAQIVKGVVLYHLADFVGCIEVLGRTDMRLPENKSSPEGYDLALRVVGYATEGYVLEQLGKELEASASYTRAAKAYSSASNTLRSSTHTSVEDVVLHQAGEAALYRLCLWSNRNSEPHIALPHHRLYIQQARSYRGSASRTSNAARTFHASRQQTVLTSLRSLISASGHWHEQSELNRAQEAMLRKTTSLPKAGDVNAPYLQFLDDVANGWKQSGAGREGAQEVVDIMYNALTHTFQSHRLLRHLARALVALGRQEEAGKALKLYLDLFNKSKETDPEKVNRELRKYRDQDRAGEKATMFDEKRSLSGDIIDEHGKRHTATDTDTDTQFIETMTFGVRVFCKYLNEPATGYKMAQRAREILDRAEDEGLKSDFALNSRVERALGISLGALTAKEANPDTRPINQAAALAHLDKSATLDPTSWETRYHLAYQLAELRQVSPALDHARKAVELAGPRASREAWHLLGLLVAAQKDMRKAMQVIETALEEDEYGEGDEDMDDGIPSSRGLAAANGSSDGLIRRLDDRLARLPPPVGSVPSSTVDSTPAVHSPGAAATQTMTRSPTSNFEFFQDQTARLVSGVQLRMTKNVIIEVLEGPEAALIDQQSLLAYFSAAYARIDDIEPAGTSSQAAVPVAHLEFSSASKKAPSLLSRPRSIKLSASDAADRSRRASLTSRSRRSLALEQAEQAVEFTAPGQGTPSSNVDGLVRSEPTIDSNPRATKLLVDLWLMSAASYRRAGRFEDSKGAIAEAEALNPDDPDVWVQFALYHLARSDLASAQTSVHKSLSFALDHPPALVLLSKLYLAACTTTGTATPLSAPTPSPLALSKQLPFAEGILETLTKRQGWDSPEAWFELSRCFRLQADGSGRRKERERECLVWALQLEETRSVRKWDDAVPRLL